MASNTGMLILVLLACFLVQSGFAAHLNRMIVQQNNWYKLTASFGKIKGTGQQAIQINEGEINQFFKDQVDPKLPAYNVVQTMGVWNGQGEPSFDINVLAEGNKVNEVRTSLEIIAKKYCATFSQEAVLLYDHELNHQQFVKAENFN